MTDFQATQPPSQIAPSVAIIIPARYGSSRFPGKPMAPIAGVPMLERVWRIARAVPHVGQVIVATDDQRIVDLVTGFGGYAVMTPESCRNGTERSLAAINQMADKPDIILNLQGDAVLTPPWILEALVNAMLANPDLPMATPATRMSAAQVDDLVASKADGQVGGTTVTFDYTGRALYFSKRVIPFIRGTHDAPPVYRHIGLYAYRQATLERLCQLQPGPLETVEQLEQLRALENGIPIQVVTVDYRGRTHWSVDAPDDVTMVEKLIAEEGELVETT
ncbi:MAG: 3-deoxy-manno-octulosonate cytidylyltransferase [Alphaproteobacteria bacterium]|nr:3-deoxy-manno-octulosonate cytidylyltransferase [Alphaproteobacteria bacterium]MAS47235.1 3-deoxy-manno-octulosonate cytidylyltransferase [Alphaproteobacteria bacterium]MAX95328.1 3-deoxy-manno-octulosonate cytidylyltransferase [Alphaproteobacteria bacterium]MBN53218.1 3-deoxy-manno-octulosonate cytidylyltransferase [Alphaproteobacteria bacterium]OUT41244.1 MAG: 3-deoxy-D-manno-octulosonate cytidylyltransferase [Micavibrio sp. TMED2]|tara:strand:- start:21220 stop:22050 length:831 start_codon:yes stop_codon:yes gene_type:complete